MCGSTRGCAGEKVLLQTGETDIFHTVAVAMPSVQTTAVEEKEVAQKRTIYGGRHAHRPPARPPARPRARAALLPR